MSLSVDFNNVKEDFNLDFFLEWLCRIEAIPFVFFYLFEGASKMFKKELLFFERFFAAFTFFMAIPLLHLIIVRYFIPSSPKDNDLFDIFYSKLTKIISLPVLFMIILFSFYNSVFRSIALFIFYFVILFWSWLNGMKDAEIGYIINYTKSKFHELLVVIVFSFIVFTVLLSFYSRSIYGNIVQSLGGGKPIEAVFVIGKSSEEVKIIDETENWIIYEDSKGKIKKINYAQVTLIKFNK